MQYQSKSIYKIAVQLWHSGNKLAVMVSEEDFQLVMEFHWTTAINKFIVLNYYITYKDVQEWLQNSHNVTVN